MFSNLKEKISRHIQVRLDLVRIEVVERSSAVMSYLIFALICLFIFGLAEVLYDMGMSRGASFLTTTGIYILVFILVVLLRRNIIRLFSDLFIRVMTEDEEDENEKPENAQK
jgi:hypothetical protein